MYVFGSCIRVMVLVALLVGYRKGKESVRKDTTGRP